MLWFHLQCDCKLLCEYTVELRIECCWHSNNYYCDFVYAQSCSKLSGNFTLLVACIHLGCTTLTWYIINDSYCIRNRFEEELFAPRCAQMRYVILYMWRCACRHKQTKQTKHKTKTNTEKKINKYLWVWMQTQKEESQMLAACNMQDMQNMYSVRRRYVPCAVCTQRCNYQNIWQNISQTQLCMQRTAK